MIKLFPESAQRILFAAPGEDPKVKSVDELVDPVSLDVVAPWKDLAIAESEVVVTTRSGLFVVVFSDASGVSDVLDEIGVNKLFSFAVVQLVNNRMFANVAPASIDFLQVQPRTNTFKGRIDIQLMGACRLLMIGQLS